MTVSLAAALWPQDRLEVQLAQTTDDRLVGGGIVLDMQAGVLRLELMQGLAQLLLIAAFGGIDGQAE
jgi:hypothetical protein